MTEKYLVVVIKVDLPEKVSEEDIVYNLDIHLDEMMQDFLQDDDIDISLNLEGYSVHDENPLEVDT
jgi:hypothetical protein